MKHTLVSLALTPLLVLAVQPRAEALQAGGLPPRPGLGGPARPDRSDRCWRDFLDRLHDCRREFDNDPVLFDECRQGARYLLEECVESGRA